MGEIIGLDTEASLGNLRVIANSQGQYLQFAQNAYTIKEVEGVIGWLFDSCQSSDYNVFYNINFDFGIILKPFLVLHEQELHDLRLEQIRKAHNSVEQGQSESVSDEDMFLKFKIGKYTVKLISHKSFSIRLKRKTVLPRHHNQSSKIS